jgi:hypothetical protein
MHEAPGSGLVRWQGGQIGEIEAAASPHATSCRARHGVKPDGSKRLTADPAKPRFHGHTLHICVASRPFNVWLSATAATTLCLCRRHFCEKRHCWMPHGAQVKAWS